MVFSTGCEPDVDWSLCDESTGFPRFLPGFYIGSAVAYGVTGVLYTVSMLRTLRTQLREQRKLHCNTAVQMHAGIVTFSLAAIIQSVALGSREPGLPPWPLLILLHLRYVWVGYVTTVLVRHWAVLYQQMRKNRQKEGQLDQRTARFVALYRDGEVVQAVITCLFYFSTVTYGVGHQERWEQVERLQLLFWAIFSGITCWLVTILGQRVHANMKKVARSRAVLDYIRRVKYVVIGSSILWCQCTVCFAMAAALTRPISGKTWVVLHSGISLTGVGTGLLYYIVIGSKIANKAANAATLEATRVPVEGAIKGAHQVQAKFQALAQVVSSGANHLMEGVSTITSMCDPASARVHIDDANEEPGLYRRIASGNMLSIRGRLHSGASARKDASTRGSEGGGGVGVAPGGILAEEAKLETGVRLDKEVGVTDGVQDGEHIRRRKSNGLKVGEGNGPHDADTKPEDGEQVWETSVMEMSQEELTSRSSSAGNRQRNREKEDSKHTGDDRSSGSEEDCERGGQRGEKLDQGKRPSRRSVRSRLSSDKSAVSSCDSDEIEDRAWQVEDLETQSVSNGSSGRSCGGSGHDGSRHSGSHHSRYSEQDSAEEEDHHHSSRSEESHIGRSDRLRSHDSDGSRSQHSSSSLRRSDSDSRHSRFSSGHSSGSTL